MGDNLIRWSTTYNPIFLANVFDTEATQFRDNTSAEDPISIKFSGNQNLYSIDGVPYSTTCTTIYIYISIWVGAGITPTNSYGQIAFQGGTPDWMNLEFLKMLKVSDFQSGSFKYSQYVFCYSMSVANNESGESREASGEIVGITNSIITPIGNKVYITVTQDVSSQIRPGTPKCMYKFDDDEYYTEWTTLVEETRYTSSSSSSNVTTAYISMSILNSISTDTLGINYRSNVSWLSASIETSRDDRLGRSNNNFEAKIEVNQNRDSEVRSGYIDLVGNDNTVFIRLTIVQQGSEQAAPISDQTDIDEILNEEKIGSPKSIIDRNEGRTLDSTELLFKFNQANIYSTIESKDNTLFLGNYKSSSTSDMFSQLENYSSEFIYKELIERVPLNIGQEDAFYSYEPNLMQDSYTKKLFKRGESYLLGMVLVYNNGYRSPVYYCERWEPQKEPEVIRDSNYNGFFTKPVRCITIPTELKEILLAKNIIGIIPVYAVNTSHNVLCQGFISPTMKCKARAERENVKAQYSWFYRTIGNTTIDQTASQFLKYHQYSLNSSNPVISEFDPQAHVYKKFRKLDELYDDLDIEIQCLDLFNLGDATDKAQEVIKSWEYNNSICTINTPEVEVSEILTEYALNDCKIKQIGIFNDFQYQNAISLTVNKKFTHSQLRTTDVSGEAGINALVRPSVTSFQKRLKSGYIWYGCWLGRQYDNSGVDPESGDDDFTKTPSMYQFYGYYKIYPWQRNTVGAEIEGSEIQNKIILNYLYSTGENQKEGNILNGRYINNIRIYRDFDTASINKLGTDLYQGNVDYLIVSDFPYKISCLLPYDTTVKDTFDEGDFRDLRKTLSSNNGLKYEYAKTQRMASYSGYSKSGDCYSPISMKYKTAPHIVVQFNDKLGNSQATDGEDYLQVVELYNEEEYIDVEALQDYTWIQCGGMTKLNKSKDARILYREGDYFYGRFDSMRTYPFTKEDPNSIVEVVSGMLCSRINLDARTDTNRGVSYPQINPENFNLFNNVYDQLNNYFTYNYIRYKDIAYSRQYRNSIQWSMTKIYGNEIDDWCNIYDVNTLDLDGDKGELVVLKRLNNSLLAFQRGGISQIQYNERTQLATTQGQPIEIANSGKVTGKTYLRSDVGCQHQKAITSAVDGLYFIDEINKTIFKINNDGSFLDLCIAKGMHSWGLSNISNKWSSYYDHVTQEVIFSDDLESLTYSNSYEKFDAFLGYGGIRWNFKMKDFIVQVCPPFFKQVLQTGYKTASTNQRVAVKYYQHNNPANTFWKKNSIDDTTIFEQKVPLELELICNPEPTRDKTFDVLEYRADCFTEHNQYLPEKSFTKIRVWNEYQDTTSLVLKYGSQSAYADNTATPRFVPLRKKFRIWRIQIPRAIQTRYTYAYLHADGTYANDIIAPENVADINTGNLSAKDRIRNPWCRIYLEMDTTDINKVIIHDLMVKYFKQ